MRVMRRHDLTKKTYILTYLPTYLPTYLVSTSFQEKSLRPVTFETVDQSDKGTCYDQKITYPPTYLPAYLLSHLPPFENTLKELSWILVSFETFDQGDKESLLKTQ